MDSIEIRGTTFEPDGERLLIYTTEQHSDWGVGEVEAAMSYLLRWLHGQRVAQLQPCAPQIGTD